MCGDFVSLHGLTNGVVAFKLPGPFAVRNLATGEKVPVVDQSVGIDMSVGRTCWLELTPERADGPSVSGPVASRETRVCRADLRGRVEVAREKDEPCLEARAWTRAFSNEIIVGGTRGCVVIIR